MLAVASLLRVDVLRDFLRPARVAKRSRDEREASTPVPAKRACTTE